MKETYFWFPAVVIALVCCLTGALPWLGLFLVLLAGLRITWR